MLNQRNYKSSLPLGHSTPIHHWTQISLSNKTNKNQGLALWEKIHQPQIPARYRRPRATTNTTPRANISKAVQHRQKQQPTKTLRLTKTKREASLN